MLPMPDNLTPRQEQLWKQYSRLASWLTEADTAMFRTFCHLTERQERQGLSAAMLREFRMVCSTLHLDPSSRARPIERTETFAASQTTAKPQTQLKSGKLLI